ncbi:MAG: hypothetical protein ACE5FY_01850 [Nitrospiria bacterium]
MMMTECPKCKTIQTIESGHFEENREIACIACHARLRLKLIAELIVSSTPSLTSSPSNTDSREPKINLSGYETT